MLEFAFKLAFILTYFASWQEASLQFGKMKNLIREVVITILLALVIFMAIRTVAYNFEVSGQSMEPNLHHGQFVMISKIAYWFDDPQRGDIVVYYSDRVNHHVIHRIVGLPGESVAIKSGDLYINGTKLEEPYIYDESRMIPAQIVPLSLIAMTTIATEANSNNSRMRLGT